MKKTNIKNFNIPKTDSKVMEKNNVKIVSPLAKYDSKGNLFCVICKNHIKSVAVWKVHVNSKLHKSNVQEAKQLNINILDKQLSKRNREEDSQISLSLKNKSLQKEIGDTTNTKNELKHTIKSQEHSDLLPEMFFDDPISDAKIRHVEHKNVQDEEWEKFQREIKEESLTSNKLVFGDQINSAVEREISEISEQIHQWSKVIDLENKLNKIVKTQKRNLEFDKSDEDLSDDETNNESLDWRVKKLY